MIIDKLNDLSRLNGNIWRTILLNNCHKSESGREYSIEKESWPVSDNFKVIFVCSCELDEIPEFVFGLIEVHNFSLSEEFMESYILEKIVNNCI
jgi:hypothetical protein